MKNLLKADFFRLFKSKLTIIMLIIDIALPLLTTLLYAALVLILKKTSGEEGVEGFDILINVKSMMTGCYSLTSNVGMLIPIFSAVFVSRDLTSGILRNKVISGHKRINIFFSHILTSIVFNVVMITIYVIMTVLFGFIFFKYGTTFNHQELINVVYFVITGTMIFIFISTFTTLLALNFKSLPPIIIFTIVFSLALNIITSILGFLDYEKYGVLMNLFPTFSMSRYTSVWGSLMGEGNVFTNQSFILGMISLAFFSALNILIGLSIFRRRELK